MTEKRGKSLPQNIEWKTLMQILSPRFCHVSKSQAADSWHYKFIMQLNLLLQAMDDISGKSEPKDQVALHYYYTSPSHWCTTDEVSKL